MIAMNDLHPVRSVEIADLTFEYDDRVLEPRPWTAGQAAWAAELLQTLADGPVLEVCSGAGHIGLLAVRHNRRSLVQVDAEPAACHHARVNAELAGMSGRVEVRCGPMDEAVRPDERFPLVIADPPWVSTDRVDEFPEDPRVAIDGGPRGLDVARRCVRLAARVLAPGGTCLLQLGDAQQAEVVSTGADLVAGELRTFERGVVLRLDRS
jgi:release factor glutamine methyltransferase